MAKKATKSSKTDSLSERLERDLAARAYRKTVAGQKLSSEERSALKRYEKKQEEERRWQYYESIPQKHWRQMSGRQTKILHDQAERYSLPFGERIISLPKVVRALHDFLADNHRRLTDEDELMNPAVASPALERYREERAILAKLDRLEREGQLIPRDQMRLGLGRIAAILRTAGETLQRQFGTEEMDVLNDALTDAERAIAELFPDNGESSRLSVHLR